VNDIRASPVSQSASFADWVQPGLLAMRRLAIRLAPQADPDDIVQESLVRAWQKWNQFDPDRGTPIGWLLTITASIAADARRHRARWRRLVDHDADLGDPAAAPDPRTDVDLERAVAGLPKRQRLAVNCHYFVGLTVAETAQVMGCSAGTVKSTLHDARTRLRKVLGDTDGQY
jgi:RNA polymerase sigma factor (sigma-70 family)